MFLRNYWYAAALPAEVTCRPLGRIFLNEPLVLFRTADGAVSALENRCPHRGFPLHRGRLINDQLECGYHGLTFDRGGRCVRLPGEARAPRSADIRSYPTLERWGLVWIWMGDTAPDTRMLPDWTFLDDPDWYARGEHLQVKCNYQLITDNLLDLSHVTYVHSRTLGSAAKLDEVQIRNEFAANSIVNSRWLIDIAPPPTYARGAFKGNVDRWQITKFEPPAFLALDAGAAATGSGAPQGDFSHAIGLRTFNAMTPETAGTCHYFWSLAQRRAPLDQKLDDAIFEDIRITVQEDIAVFEAHQRALELKPNERLIAIKSDAALLAARRMIERLLEGEQAKAR